MKISIFDAHNRARALILLIIEHNMIKCVYLSRSLIITCGNHGILTIEIYALSQVTIWYDFNTKIEEYIQLSNELAGFTNNLVLSS